MLFISAPPERATDPDWHCFNLAIEMLFISGTRGELAIEPLRKVSISQSRGFSVQGFRLCGEGWTHQVSISQSRCFSFQGSFELRLAKLPELEFQSRNREAFQFRFSQRICFLRGTYVSISQSRGFSFQAGSAHLRDGGGSLVSISQSRGFSFQAKRLLGRLQCGIPSFNLAIERLFISGSCCSNCWGINVSSFNLAIERLFSSG